MNCQEIKELLSAFIDDELEEKLMQNVQEHIDSCSACKKEVEELEELKNILSAIDDAPVPDQFNARLHLALKDEAKKMKQEKLIPIKKTKFANWRRISSIAAIFMVGLFSVILYNNNLDEFNQQNLQNEELNSPSAVLAPKEEAKQEAKKTTDSATLGEPQTGAVVEAAPKSAIQEDVQPPIVEEQRSNKAKAVDDAQGVALDEAEGSPNLQSYAMPALTSEQGTETTDSAVENNQGASPQTTTPLNSVALPVEIQPYMEQLEQILIDKNYEVDSYTVDSATGIWTISITITTINAHSSETKESAVYCGQDGNLWKKEL